MIICIGKSCGSGGHEIGEKLAKALGYAYYDQKAVEGAANRDVYETTPVEKDAVHVQLTGDATGSISEAMELGRTQLLAKNGVLLKAASRGSCVVDVNCADYILKEAGFDRVSIFITAPIEDRVARKKAETGKDELQTTAFIRAENLRRKNYYNYITGGSWGSPENYDICINSSAGGVDKTVAALQHLVETL